MMKKPDSAQTKKEALFQAAVKCFSRNGFAGTRMDDVVKAAGIAKGTAYRYFKNKETLHFFLFERTLEEVFESVRSKTSGVTDLKTAAGKAISIYLDFFHKHKDRFSILLQHIFAAKRSQRVLFDRRFFRLLMVLEPQIREGITRGQLKPCDPIDILTAGMGVLNSFLMQSFVKQRSSFSKKKKAMIIDFVLKGIQLTP